MARNVLEISGEIQKLKINFLSDKVDQSETRKIRSLRLQFREMFFFLFSVWPENQPWEGGLGRERDGTYVDERKAI